MPYSVRIASRSTTTLDRQSLSRYAGVELPNCKGPYAVLFEKLEKGGVLRCAGGSLKQLSDIQGSDEEILRALGVSPKDIPCAAIVSTEKMDKFSTARALSSTASKSKSLPHPAEAHR